MAISGYNGTNDQDPVTRLANILERSIVGPTQQVGLTDEQRRLVLQFRAVRNGLGNFGRHGETRFNVFVTPPHVNKTTRVLTFFEPGLPRETKWVNLLYSNGKKPITIDVGDVDDYTWNVNVDETDINCVEAVDGGGTPLALGVPFGPFLDQQHSTTVTGIKLEPNCVPDSSSVAVQQQDTDDRRGD